MNAFSQINSPNGSNLFYYNGAADVTFRYQPRGSGGRAFVHADGNILGLNFESDFTGGTRIGNDVFFKDGGNSYINSGNFGIGTSSPTTKLELSVGYANSITNAFTLKNTFDGYGLVGTGILFTGYYKHALISAYGNPQIRQGGKLQFQTYDSDAVLNTGIVLNEVGNVGIGTTNPIVPLTVYGKSYFFPARIGSGDARSLEISNASSMLTFVSNDYPVFLKTGGGDQPLILSAARVGIGTTNPSSMLTVAGDINSREVKVTVNAGADFVFAEDYDLPSLDSVNKYIAANKHLPEIASAKEMQENGINLSEMNIKLLQKVEELTLYVIEQNKKLEVQQKEINSQSEEIVTLHRENKIIKTLSERILEIESKLK
jgi:hypothetical protein